MNSLNENDNYLENYKIEDLPSRVHIVFVKIFILSLPLKCIKIIKNVALTFL